jgi:outer membrane lipase/esterase
MSGQINGTNFAFGGARVGSTPPLGFPFSLVDQVSAYALLLNGNPAPSNALFIVEGGGNDVRDVFAAAIDGDPTTDPNALIQNYLDGMTTVLNTLAYVGAQHIAVWNVPDIGITPAVQSLVTIEPMATLVAGGIAMAMNSELELLLNGFDAVFDGDLMLFDLHDAMANIYGNPGLYGLTNVSDPCAVSIACVNDPSGYLFWDGIHPTTYGHSLLAQAFLAAVPIGRVPEPGTLWLMLVALLPAVFRQRSARR